MKMWVDRSIQREIVASYKFRNKPGCVLSPYPLLQPHGYRCLFFSATSERKRGLYATSYHILDSIDWRDLFYRKFINRQIGLGRKRYRDSIKRMLYIVALDAQFYLTRKIMDIQFRLECDYGRVVCLFVCNYTRYILAFTI